MTIQHPVDNIILVYLGSIKPNPYQPPTRCDVSNETADKFADSILLHGLLQKPVVRAIDNGNYEMADGWLRYNGFRRLVARGNKEYERIPVIIRELTNLEMADMVIEANTVRKDLNPIELADLYKKYRVDFDMPVEEVAKRHHCSAGEISNNIRLLDLPEVVRQLIVQNGLKPTHARALLPLKDPLQQTMLADKVLNEGMTVAALEDMVRELLGKEKKEKPQEITRSEEDLMTDVRRIAEGHVIDAVMIQRELKVGYPLAARLFEKYLAEQTPLPPPVIPSTDNDARAEAPDPVTSVRTESKPAAKPTPTAKPAPVATKPVPAPAAPPVSTPFPTTAKPAWKRKLILEEREGFTMASMMGDGQPLMFHRFEGDLDQALEGIQSMRSENNGTLIRL